MAIPDFQTIMLPLLQHMADGKKHSNRELTETLADYFQLTEEERTRLLPSGNQKLFNNRVAWAKTDLKMAGLIDSPRRGISVITQLGTDVLQHPPERIDRNFLKQFPEYFEKITQGGKKRIQKIITRSCSLMAKNWPG